MSAARRSVGRCLALCAGLLSPSAFADFPTPSGAWRMPDSSAAPPAAARPLPKAVFNDPIGDTFGGGTPQHDITRFTADIVNSNLVVTISFAGAISPPDSGRADGLQGYVDIDTDGNTSETASFVAANCREANPPIIGTDYVVSVFGGSTSSTAIFSVDSGAQTGTVATSYSSNSVTLTVPLSSMAVGSAPIRLATVLGTIPEPTDCAPAGTSLVASTAVVGPPVLTSGSTQAGATMTFQAPTQGVRYDWDFDGDGIIDRTGASNALDVTYPGAFNGTVSVLVTGADGTRTVSSRTLVTSAPRLGAALEGGTLTQLCGDGDAAFDPGETFRVPVRVTNLGTAATQGDAQALFSSSDRMTAATAGQSIDGKLIVQTPLVDVGALAPNASVVRSVDVTVAPNAGCNAGTGFVFGGGYDGVSSGGMPSTLFTFTTASTCQVYTANCPAIASAKAVVVPRQGLYFNPARPGNGLSNFVIPVQGASPVFFGAWFTGAADRTPTWYVVQGNLVGNSVVAPLYRFTRDLAASSFTVQSTVVGTAIVTLKASEQMAFLWTIGSKTGLELMTYLTPGPVAAPNRTGAWYNASESGWGQVVHSFAAGTGNSIFVVDYIYDAAGEPRWVLSQAAESALASGAPHTTFTVHCPGCPWIADWASFPLSAGSGNDVFLDATNGRTSTSFTFPTPMAGNWFRTNLPIVLLTVPQ
jgi:hypothetical protein